MNSPPITVILATKNGARTLPAVLERHRCLMPAAVPHRLVVVDNASGDATPDILRAEEARRPLVVLRESGRGKNRALNRALPEIMDSELVVFTDDDALPEPDWLQRLWEAAVAQPDYAVFGGTIQPHWMVPPPAWIVAHGVPVGVVYAATVWQSEGPITADLVWGPNMAVRGAVFRAGHRFDEGVGPDGGTRYGMGSETEFTVRLQRAGYRAWFAADAMVGHMVRPEQMTESWVLSRAWRHGLGYHRYHPPPKSRLPCIAGVPLRLAARMAGYSAAAWAVRVLPTCRIRFRVMWQAQWLAGVVAGLRVQGVPRTRHKPMPRTALEANARSCAGTPGQTMAVAALRPADETTTEVPPQAPGQVPGRTWSSTRSAGS